MRGYRFRYRTSLFPDKADPTPLAPRIPIVLFGKGGRSIQNMGLIDSGSTDTSIGRDIADILGLELRDKIEIRTAGGRIPGYQSKISIEIPIKHNPVRLSNIPCSVIDGFDEVILGRAGFFNAFEITFCESEKWISLKDVHSKPASVRH